MIPYYFSDHHLMVVFTISAYLKPLDHHVGQPIGQIQNFKRYGGSHPIRCVKIMAAEHIYKMLLAESKKRKREDRGEEPGEEAPVPKASSRRKTNKAKTAEK